MRQFYESSKHHFGSCGYNYLTTTVQNSIIYYYFVLHYVRNNIHNLLIQQTAFAVIQSAQVI